MTMKSHVFHIFPAVILFAGTAWAHREHGKHVHGHAELSIAFEGAKGRVEFQTPAESIIGFEHEAKTAAQKKTVAEATKKFSDHIATMVKWDPSLGCQSRADKVETRREKGSANHSEFSAAFDVTCAKSPRGSTVTFDFQTVFPKLRDIDATILMDNLQKTLEIKSANQTLTLN